MAHFLVTGASGFLGMQTSKTLLESGHQVTACGRNLQRLKKLAHKNLTILQHDISLSFKAHSCAKNIDFIIHCAALSSPWGKKEDFFKCNVLGTQHVLELAMDLNVKRLINISTPSVYFDYTDRLNLTEEDVIPQKKVNNYAASKWQAEELLHKQSVVPIITLRPKAIIGPGDPSIMPRVLNCIRNGRLPLIDGGVAQLNITYIDDVVESILLSCNAPKEVDGRRLNITNDTPVAVGALLKLVLEKINIPFKPQFVPFSLAFFKACVDEVTHKYIFNSEPALTRYAVGAMAKSQTFDIALARKCIGFNPKFSVEKAIENYAKWYLDD